MKLLLDRKWKKDTYSIGILYIDGVRFCETLEDKDRGLTQVMPEAHIRQLKVKGETAIPKGTYEVSITYSPRFNRKLPLLSGVKGFDGIRIHTGNSASDSQGCILVGENKVKGKVINSKATFDKLFKKLQEAIDKEENISITIV